MQVVDDLRGRETQGSLERVTTGPAKVRVQVSLSGQQYRKTIRDYDQTTPIRHIQLFNWWTLAPALCDDSSPHLFNGDAEANEAA